MSFTSTIKIHFDDADPAGVCFYAKIIGKTHQVYEEIVESFGLDVRSFFSGEKWLVPIRHTEAEYLKPLKALTTYSVTVSQTKISESSFTLSYSISEGTELCALVRTTHVFLETKTGKKCEIPEDFKKGLESLSAQ